MDYVVQISSLYPIDLSSILFLGLHIPDSKIKIYINEIAELPLDTNNRRYVARAALPLLNWELDKKKVWRQIHSPLENLNFNEYRKVLFFVGQSIVGRKRSFKLNIVDNLFQRCEFLSNSVYDRMKCSNQEWKQEWARFAASLIEEIFEQVIGYNKTKVLSYAPYRLGLKGKSKAIHFLENIFCKAKLVYPNSLTAKRGGYVEIYDEGNSKKWLRFSRFKADGQNLLLIDKKFKKFYCFEFSKVKSSNVRIRFGGLLELGFLQEFGYVVDLPWFSDGIFSKNYNDRIGGIEIISPISTSFNSRISKKYGGNEWRLFPTGYSLLDFDSKMIFEIAKVHLKIKEISNHDLQDWQRLAFNYPRCNQKLSKHQKAIKAYRDIREQETKTDIRESRIDEISIIEISINELSPLRYGEYITILIGLISQLKEWCTPACSKRAPGEILNFLKKIGWINSPDILSPDNVMKIVKDCVTKVSEWLLELGMDRSFYDTLIKKLSITNEIVIQAGNRSVCRPFQKNMSEKGGGLGYVIKILRTLFDEYYGFVSFCLGSLFKMNILISYLILGPNEFKSAILGLINKRDCAYYKFDPILLEIYNENKLSF